MSGVPAELISALRFEPIAFRDQPNLKFAIRARTPDLQPPPPRLPADQALAPDLLKLYREAALKASAKQVFLRCFQHVLSPVITEAYDHRAV
jgi:hypothetical protein